MSNPIPEIKCSSLKWAILAAFLAGGMIACSSAPREIPESQVQPAGNDNAVFDTGIREPDIPVPDEPGVRGILRRISRLLDQRDFTGALALFDEIDKEEAEESGIQLLKASVLSSAGKRKESRDIVDRIIVREPDNLEAWFIRAALEGMDGREREQRNALERIIKADPVHVAALTELGNIALRGRSLRIAASYFDRALAASPNDGDALIGRAGTYRYTKEPQKAEALFNRAIKLYPQWAVPYSERARLYRDAGYPQLALTDLDAAQRIDANNYWICYDRGNVLLDLNRQAEALKEFNRAISLDPNNFLAYVYTAGLKDDLGDLDGAEQDYERLTQLRPDYYFAFEGLGLHKMRKRRWGEAKDAFLEAYAKAPQETSYALLGAINWMRAGRVTDPRQFLENAQRKVNRESLDWYMLRLYHDFSGEMDVAQRIDRERSPSVKSKMLFYLAMYYDVRNNRALADQYFLMMHELGPQGILEWKINQWIVTERNLGQQ